jgi:hypothetical protein
MKWGCISAIKPISCKTRQPEICTIQPYLCLSIDYTLSGIITLCCYHLWIFYHLALHFIALEIRICQNQLAPWHTTTVNEARAVLGSGIQDIYESPLS